jgi:hypothetical protein
VNGDAYEPADQQADAGDPVNMPEGGDQADHCSPLPHRLADNYQDGLGPPTVKSLLSADQDQRSKKRDGDREGNDADRCGQIERWGRQERLHHQHRHPDQRAIGQGALVQPLPLLGLIGMFHSINDPAFDLTELSSRIGRGRIGTHHLAVPGGRSGQTAAQVIMAPTPRRTSG